MTFELWDDAYVLELILMALAILSKTTGTLAWEMVPNAHFHVGRGGPTLCGLKDSYIKQESASLETDDCCPQASAVLLRIAAITRDPQQNMAIWGIFSQKEGLGIVITPLPEIPAAPT